MPFPWPGRFRSHSQLRFCRKPCTRWGPGVGSARFHSREVVPLQYPTTLVGMAGDEFAMSVRSHISRRDLLKYLGSAGIGLAVSPILRSDSQPQSSVTFVDVARSGGITFQHDNAASTEKYLIETMGSGCGWIDYDQNGLLDLYLVNGAATRVYSPKRPLSSALYRNN